MRIAGVLALLLISSAAAVHADAWTTFERHCLTPLVAAENPLTSDFAQIYDEADSAQHQLAVGEATVTVIRYKDPGFEPMGCEVHAETSAAWEEIAAGHAAWSEQVLREDSFQTLPGEEGLFSTFQREPLVQVILVGPDATPRPFVSVEETRLES